MTRAERTSLTVGCLLYLGTAPLLLFIFGMSTLSGGAYEDGTWEWWVAVLGTMFRPGQVGPVTLTLLVGLVVGGLLIGRGLWRRFGGVRVTIRGLMVAVMLVALGLAFAPLGFLVAVLAPVMMTLIALVHNPALASGSPPRFRVASRGDDR